MKSKIRLSIFVVSLGMLELLSCFNQSNTNYSVVALDSNNVLRAFYNQRICFRLTRIGIRGDEIPPPPHLYLKKGMEESVKNYRNRKEMDFILSHPVIETCNSDSINYIIAHFKAYIRNYIHHCYYDYNFEVYNRDKIIMSGMLNSGCGDILLDDTNDHHIYGLDTIEFNKIKKYISK